MKKWWQQWWGLMRWTIWSWGNEHRADDPCACLGTRTGGWTQGSGLAASSRWTHAYGTHQAHLPSAFGHDRRALREANGPLLRL